MPPRNRFITCEICGDRASKTETKSRIFMAKFPLDEARCRKWVQVTGKEDLIYVPIEKLHALKYVCGSHFEKSAFNKRKSRLRKTAIPSKNLKADPLPDQMLLEFPCHVALNTDFTNDSISQRMSDMDVSLPHVEPMAGPSHSESYMSSGQQLSTQASGEKKKNTEFTNYNISQGMSDMDVSLSHVEPMAGPSHSESYKPGQQLSTQTLSQKIIIRSHQRKLSQCSEEQSITTQPQLVDHNYCIINKEALSPKRMKMTGPDFQITPRKRKLLKKIYSCKSKMKILREGNIMPRIKSLVLRTLIKAYLRNHNRKPGGKRWTSLEKSLAIAIYKKSPRTYRHLQHLIALPSIRTLQTLVQSIELEPGIGKSIMHHLQKKAAKLNEKNKMCALLFDEIALKKRLIFNSRTDKVEGFVDLGENQYRSSDIADHALVFMLQGLYKKLKQPIAYYFVKGTVSSQSLAVIIKDIVKAVTDIGYIVVTTVCDQGPTNMGSLNLLKQWCGIPTTSNYFLLDDEKIFIMFDIPHLFKSIRNNFHSGGEIILDGKKGKWSHLLDVAEKNKSVLHFKKLTALHVNPTYKSKMKVKLAAQVLSNTVAAILKLMAEKYGNDVKGREILDTAHVIDDLNGLFDCTNGPSSKEDIIKFKRENVSKKTNHLDLWKHYKKIVSSMYFQKSDSFLRLKNVRCVLGYVTSLSSLEDIWKYLESKGFKYLNLRQLNQDSLENLFGMIRQHCPTNRNPTCHHFTAALKSNILTKLSTPVGRGTNCENDNNEAFLDFEDFFENVKNTEDVQLESHEGEVLGQRAQFSILEDAEAPVLHLPEYAGVGDLEFPEDDMEFLEIENSLFEMFEKQPTVYVAGYLASAVLKKIRWQCDNCKRSLKVDDPQLCDTPMYSFIKLREWWQDKKSLTYPTTNLCKLVDTVTSCFDTLVKPNLHEKYISQRAITMMLAECDNLLWICKDHNDRLLSLLLVRLTYLLIRNECHRINLLFAKAEETTADFVKKAQQQGTSK